MSSIALAAHAPELVRALVLVDITPGVNAEKAAPVTNFVNGPASFDSFDELLARTMEHNPTRSESSLRRGILHNAVQREDGSWVWRYARFRTEPGSARARVRRLVGGRLGPPRAPCCSCAAWPGRWSTTTTWPSSCAASPPPRWSASRGRATASRATGRSSWPRILKDFLFRGRMMDKNVWLSRRALKLHAVILILVPAFMALCIWQITRAVGRQQPELGLRVRVADLRRLRRLHVVALRARGRRGHAARSVGR